MIPAVSLALQQENPSKAPRAGQSCYRVRFWAGTDPLPCPAQRAGVSLNKHKPSEPWGTEEPVGGQAEPWAVPQLLQECWG